MKLKVNNDKLDKSENTSPPKPPTDPQPVIIAIEKLPQDLDENLPALCCEMGCQLAKISTIALAVSAISFLFGIVFYQVVLINYGL